jgi:hypothetical protein
LHQIRDERCLAMVLTADDMYTFHAGFFRYPIRKQ